MSSDSSQRTASQISKQALGMGASVAAAALGSAAILYRTGSIARAASSLDRGYRFLRSATKTAVSHLGKEDITIEDVRAASKEMMSTWQRISKQEADKTIRLRVDHPKTMFSLMHSLVTAKNSVGHHSLKLFQQNVLAAPARDLLVKKYGNELDKNALNKFYNFIHAVSENSRSIENVSRETKRNHFTTRESEIAQELVNFMREKDLPEARSDYQKSVRAATNAAYEKLHDIDYLESHFGKPSLVGHFASTLLGDRSASIGDILEHKTRVAKSIGSITARDGHLQPVDTIEMLEDLHEHFKSMGGDFEKRFLALRPDADALRRSADGSVYSLNTPHQMWQDFLNVGALTLPGKILKLRDIEQSAKAPSVQFIADATSDPALAAIVNRYHDDGYRNRQVEGNFIRLMDQLYRFDDKGKMQAVDGANDLVAISSRFGWQQRMIHYLAGDVASKQSGNPLFHALDIFQDRSKFSGNVFGWFTSRMKKFGDDDWRGNVFQRFLSPDAEQLEEFAVAMQSKDIDYAVDYLDKAKRVQKFLKENTYGLDNRALSQLSKIDGDAGSIFKSLYEKSDDELLAEIMSPEGMKLDVNEFLNTDLRDIFQRYRHDPVNARNAMYLKTDRVHISNPGGSLFGLASPDFGTEGAGFSEILRGELAKEAFLRYAKEHGDESAPNYQSVLDLVGSLKNGTEKTNAKRLALLAFFQQRSGIAKKDSNIEDIDLAASDLWEHVRRIEGVMNTNTDSIDQEFRKTFKQMMEENISITEARAIEDDVTGPEPYNTFIHMRRAVGPLDILKSINESIRSGNARNFSNTASLFLQQFTAGRNDMENVTTATMLPYFALARLSDDLNTFGFGFSADSLASTGTLAKSILAKRILPVAIGGTYLEWADDTSQEITGTSISGAAANGLANVDLAIRKSLDALGITPWLKEEKLINPIMQYWGDHDEFMDYAERKKWYESGYDPVRKGAWWTWGGIQEARGGEIEYWSPTFARRINSDYKDNSLYDGYFDKWSHSLLPTPANPISPLLGILDPYWLEEKHEDDRPYPVSGPMFSEKTPWGAVLNPTVGEIIKPQEELHPWRLRNGVDITSALYALNENIKAKARDLGHQNLIALKGDQMSPVRFTGFDAPTADTKILSTQYSDKAGGFYQSAGTYGVYDAGNHLSVSAGFQKFMSDDKAASALLGGANHSLKRYASSLLFNDSGTADYHADGEIMQTAGGELGAYYSTAESNSTSDLKEQTKLSLADSLKLDSFINGDDGWKSTASDLVRQFDPVDILRAHNAAIKSKASHRMDAFDAGQGILTPEKLSHFKPSQGMELLDDPDMVAELIHQGKGSDFVRDASTSFRLISGIYGYAASKAIGLGVYHNPRIATSNDMYSPARTFWDMNLGGMGGDFSDIIHRFIPDFKRGAINPLMNTMPDWMPARFRYGDPFSQIKEGEMRLPGKGYESLNQLHPDQYGDYGAFDRFKILADIAPFSPEYKIWREIAKKTVMDPNLVEEMSDIRHRVSKQGKKHDFFDYNVVGKSLDYQEVTISEVLGYGKFRSGSTIYKMAGARVLGNQNETMTDVLGRYLHVGDTVTVAVDSDDAYQRNRDADQSTNAAVYINGQNLAESMIAAGDAARKNSDTSTPAVLGRMTSFQKMIGYASEMIAHADLPWISDQWLRVRSPLESYDAEQVYGTPYQSWDRPIDTFLLPAMERAVHQSDIFKTILRTGFQAIEHQEGLSKTQKNLLSIGYAMSDRGAFIGAAISNLVDAGNGRLTRKMMAAGSTAASAGHFLSGGNSMADEITSGGALGYNIARFFKKNRELGTAIGIAVGAAYRLAFGDSHDWIPERAKRKWEMQDYFDRLTYLKYMGLYHKAAELAKEEEDIDVEDLYERKNERHNFVKSSLSRLKRIKEALRSANDHIQNEEKKSLTKMLNRKINGLDEDVTILEGGKWTHSALIYKQAAESTMYGINQDSSWAQIIAALPVTDREYFMEFVKERNPDKRDEILHKVSPFLQKALSLSWGIKKPSSESNDDFFKNHKLPASTWEGWRPDTDLKNLEIKTIENEGMNLSDFGYYDSQLLNPDVAATKPIDYHSRDNTTSVKHNLEKILHGKGLKNIDVNVTTSNDIDAHTIISDIKMHTGLSERKQMVQNSIELQLH